MQSAWAILSSVAYPALQYFSTLSHKRHNFWKTMWKIKCVFSVKFVLNISHSKTYWAIYDQKCILIFMQSYRYSCQNLMKLEFSRQFRKIFRRQISWKSAQWEPICSIRTDRHDEAHSRYSQFAKALKNMFDTKPEMQLPFYAVLWAVGSSAVLNRPCLNVTMRMTAFGLKHPTWTVHTGTFIDEDALRRRSAVEQWLRCCATIGRSLVRSQLVSVDF